MTSKRECGPTHYNACQCREEHFAKLEVTNAFYEDGFKRQEAKLKLAEEALATLEERGCMVCIRVVRTALAELRKA